MANTPTLPGTSTSKPLGGRLESGAERAHVFPPQSGFNRVNRRERQLVWQVGPAGWFVIDCSIAVLATLAAYILSPFTEVLAVNPEYVGYLRSSIPFAIILGVLAHVIGLHENRMPRIPLDLVGRSCLAVGLAMMLLNMGLLILFYEKLGRYISAYMCIFATLGLVATRLLVWKMTQTFVQNICFIGSAKFVHNGIRFLQANPISWKNVNVIDWHEDVQIPLSQWAVENDLDEIVFDSNSSCDTDAELIRCLDEGLKVSTYAEFVESNFQFVPVDQIDAKWLLLASVEVAHPYYNGVKRLIDVCIAAVGLVITSPILLLAMACIKLESRGPVVYSQERMGRFKRVFRIYKLRSMVQDAEAAGAQWAKSGDARITRVGRFLRKTRIDELPQFWNVLQGDMSLVGPRPERPEFVDLLAAEIPFYHQRHLVKPGLTGWAQINYPYGASVDDAVNKLKYDLYYVKRASVLLDLQIALRTFGTIMQGSR